jgi:diacylglycerol kinase (ATP)
MPIGESNRFHRPEGSGAKNQQEKICLIVNPRAGAGRAGSQIDTLKRLLDRSFEQWDVQLTQAPRHATHLAREAAEKGFDIVAAVGGDGTCHEVVNGLMKNGRAVRKKTAFTVIPFGTGSDLVRSLDIPSRTGEALWIAATGISLPSDVGTATFTTDKGVEEEVFINVAGFGANGDVVRRANSSSKRFGGAATFIGATLRTLVRYEPGEVRVTIEGSDSISHWENKLLSSFIANGHYCGSGMFVGNGGSMQDGKLDLSLLKPTPLLRQALDFRHLYDGKLGESTGVTQTACTKIQAECTTGAPVPVELDGESRGILPASFAIHPGALTIRGGWLRKPE